MPVCPRCGKSLSSDQALTYHLNRKYKCGTWKCAKCETLFDTKFALNIHETACNSDRKYIIPSYDVLCNIYSKSSQMLFIEIDTNKIIHSISPNCENILGFKQQELIGKCDTSVVSDNQTILRKTKNCEDLELKRTAVHNNIYVEYIS